MVREEALDWLDEAEADLTRAERAKSHDDYSLACYLAQQAAEKALKAASIGLARKRPAHLHDLLALYSSVKDVLPLDEGIVERLPDLSQYYVTARYPNAGVRRPSRSFKREQAERALSTARDVVSKVKSTLNPK